MISKAFTLYKQSVSGLSIEVWFLSLVTFINRSGTMVIPFLGVYMTTKLGFSIAEAGWVLLFFGMGSLAGSYIGGYLTDKIGYYWVMLLSLFLGGTMFILLGFVDSFWAVCAIVLLTSTVGDALRPAAMTAIAVHSKPENRTRAFSLMRMAINFGWAMGPAMGGWLVKFQGYWALFWADGITCILAALVFWLCMKEKESDAARKKVLKNKELSPFRDKEYLFFLVLTLLGGVVFMQFLYTLPIFYKQELQFSDLMIGNLLALNGLLIAFVEMPLVYILEKRFRPLDNVWIGVVMFGVAYLFLNVNIGAGLLVAVISMVVLSVGEIFNMPFTNTYAMSRAREENRGAYMGLFSMTFSVAHILGPPIGTQTVHHFGFDALWLLMGALSAITALGYFRLRKKSTAPLWPTVKTT